MSYLEKEYGLKMKNMTKQEMADVLDDLVYLFDLCANEYQDDDTKPSEVIAFIKTELLEIILSEKDFNKYLFNLEEMSKND